MSSPTANLLPPSLRRWLQISLRTLLVGITLLAVFLGVVVNGIILPAERQRAAVAAIREIGGTVVYVEPTKSEPWAVTELRKYLPADYFDEVRSATIPRYEEIFAMTTEGQCMSWRNVIDRPATESVDAVLAHVPALPKLLALDLREMHFTPAGVANLAASHHLEILDLSGSDITDQGLAHLHSLTHLKQLKVSNREGPTPEGIAALQRALPACKVEVVNY